MMTFRLQWINSVRFLLGLSLVLTLAPIASVHADDLLDNFRKHVTEQSELSSKTRDEALQAVAEFAESPADAITEALIIMYPAYGDAVAASDDENVQDSLQLLQPLVDSKDPFLAADASFYLARVLMNDEQYEQALPLLGRLTDDLESFSAHGASASFYRGVALAGLLKNQEAIEAFMQFLHFYPDAPERLRVSAWRQVQQLQAVKEGQLSDVSQRMEFSRRRLELKEPDEVTQQQQKKIVEMLAKLIKEQEKKECSSSKSSSKNTKQQQQQQQQQQQASKPKNNKSQKGGSSSNPNGSVVEKSYDDGPASPWSRLRDRSRDPANNAIKERLPARYRDIVEKYYEKANGTDKR